VLLAFGLQLPAAPPPSPPAGPAASPPVTRPAPAAPWAAVWNHAIESASDLHLAVSNDFVFVAGAASPLEARAAATGDVAWRHTNPSWQVIAATGALVLGVSGDHAYALDAATGRTRWVTETTGSNTRLAVDGPHLLMLSDNDLLLREVATGTPLWRAGLTAAPSAPPAFGPDVVAVAQEDGVVRALDRATGELRWQAKLSSPPRALTVMAPVIYAGLASGAFCALNDRNGSERWCFPLRVPMAGPAVVDGDVVRVALLDNSLRSFHRLNGAMGQQGSLGHRPATGPWLTGSALVVALTTGEFVVIDRSSGRTVTRLQVPDAVASSRLERAAIGPDGLLLASLTMGPDGERRLSVYRPRTAGSLPVTPDLPVTPGPRLDRLPPPPPPINRAGPRARPLPFPVPR
jgi:outer membrane protein assembly factor BamB